MQQLWKCVVYVSRAIKYGQEKQMGERYQDNIPGICECRHLSMKMVVPEGLPWSQSIKRCCLMRSVHTFLSVVVLASPNFSTPITIWRISRVTEGPVVSVQNERSKSPKAHPKRCATRCLKGRGDRDSQHKHHQEEGLFIKCASGNERHKTDPRRGSK